MRVFGNEISESEGTFIPLKVTGVADPAYILTSSFSPKALPPFIEPV